MFSGRIRTQAEINEKEFKIMKIILLTNNSQRKEFQNAKYFFENLKKQDPYSVCFFSSESELENSPQANDIEPELCVLFEDFPGRFSNRFWRKFRSKYPLIRFLLISGALCQGEERTGSLEQGIVRCPWYHWRDFAQKEVIKFLNGEKSVFSLEETALFEDFVFETSSFDRIAVLPDRIRQGWVAADDPRMRKFFTGLFEKKGKSISASTPSGLFQKINNQDPCCRNCDLFIIDVIDLAQPGLEENLCRLAACNSRAEICLLATGPNPEEVELFESISHCRIVAKPFFSGILEE